MESGLAVTVLEVDLELSSGEEIPVDPGLAVPEHRHPQSPLFTSPAEIAHLMALLRP